MDLIGPALVVIAVVVVLPLTFMALGAIISVVFGWSLRSNAEALHEGSELIDLNR